MSTPRGHFKTQLVFEIVQLLKVEEPEAGYLRVKLTILGTNALEVIAKHLREL